jgi:hypothetical protein
MSTSRIIELVAGLATILVAVFLNGGSRIESMFLLAVPGILVGLGAAAHSLRHSLLGLALLIFGTILNCVIIIILAVPLVWAYRAWGGLIITEFCFPLIAVVAAFFSRRNRTALE